jgi:hypothetical protein
MRQKYDICAMKYRMLSDEELQALEPELKEFLIVNGFDGEVWEQLNREQPEKAVALVGLFSDIVLEKVYKKVDVVEKRDAENRTLIRIGATALEMFHVSVKKNSTLDLAEVETIPGLLNRHRDALDFYRGQKPLQLTREEEVHRLILQGFAAVPIRLWEEMQAILG